MINPSRTGAHHDARKLRKASSASPTLSSSAVALEVGSSRDDTLVDRVAISIPLAADSSAVG
jgi:hypothetical protein